jgi:GH18 family chitinase
MLQKMISTILLFGLAFLPFAEAQKIIGFFPSWAQYSQFYPKDVRFDFLTHVHYAYFVADEAGGINAGDETDLANFENLVKLAKAKGVKILVTVGGSENADVISALAGDEAKRGAFVGNLMTFIKAKGIDGIELDWQPKDSDKGNYASLLKALAASFAQETPKLLLSATATWDESATSGYDVEALALADYVNVQTIDVSPAEGTVAAPVASLPVTIQALNFWKGKGISAQKLNPMVPFYGRSFLGAKGLGTPSNGPGSGNEGLLSYKELMEKFNGNTYTVTLDKETSSEVAVSAIETIAFNGIPSIRSVASFVKANGFGGVAISDLQSDADHWKVSLLVTIGKELRPNVNYKQKQR